MTNQNKMDDKFKSTMQKILVAFIITLAVIIVGAFVYIYIRSPKTTNLADSTLFTEEEVYSKSEEIIGLFENGEYDGLRALCNTEMVGRMTDDVLKNGMDSFGGSLGERIEVTSKEGVEAKQSDGYYAMTRYKIKYENIELTYTIILDTDMKLAGFAAEPVK